MRISLFRLDDGADAGQGNQGAGAAGGCYRKRKARAGCGYVFCAAGPVLPHDAGVWMNLEKDFELETAWRDWPRICKEVPLHPKDRKNGGLKVPKIA